MASDFLNAVFAVISFSAASNRSPTQAGPTVSENIGEDVASVERIIETTIASQDVEANPEVGSFTHCVSTTFITIFLQKDKNTIMLVIPQKINTNCHFFSKVNNVVNCEWNEWEIGECEISPK